MSPVPNVLPIGHSTEVARKSTSPSQSDQKFSQVLESASRNASLGSEAASQTERQKVTGNNGSKEARPQTNGQGPILESCSPKAAEDTEGASSFHAQETDSGGQKLPQTEESAGLSIGEPDQKCNDANAPNESTVPDFSLPGMNGFELYTLDGMMISTSKAISTSAGIPEVKQADSTVKTAIPDTLPIPSFISAEFAGGKLDELNADSDIEGFQDLVPTALTTEPTLLNPTTLQGDNSGKGKIGSLEATAVAENAVGSTLPASAVPTLYNDPLRAPASQFWTESQPTTKNSDSAAGSITIAGLTTDAALHSSSDSNSVSETASFSSIEEAAEISLPPDITSLKTVANQYQKEFEPGTIVLELKDNSLTPPKPSAEGRITAATELMKLQRAAISGASLIAPIQSDKAVPSASEVVSPMPAAAEGTTASAKIAVFPDTLQSPAMMEKESAANSKTKSSLEDNGKPLVGTTKAAQAAVEKEATESDYRTYQEAPKPAHSSQLESRDHSDGRSLFVSAGKTEAVIAGSVTIDSKFAAGMSTGHISTQQTTAHSSLASAMDQVDKAVVISQLIEKANWISGKQGGELLISLKPEFLGRINLQASMVDHALVATITAESPTVKSLLESQIGTLQQSLYDQGLPVSKIVVVQGNDMSFASFGSGQAHAEQHLPQSQPARMPFVSGFQPLESEPGGMDVLPVFHQASNRSLNLMA